jgi:hypothetical protein
LSFEGVFLGSWQESVHGAEKSRIKLQNVKLMKAPRFAGIKSSRLAAIPQL